MTNQEGAHPLVRDLRRGDHERLAQIVEASWGSTGIVSRGRLIDVLARPGFVATTEDGEWLGYCSYEVVDHACEVIVIEALGQGIGVGTRLLARLVWRCLDEGVERIWLVTTNDNTDALRWYQRKGFELVALHRDAITAVRHELKPEIPVIGDHGIEIRDELELELPRARWDAMAR